MLSVHYKDASWTFVAVINMELCPVQKEQGQFLLPAGRSTLLVWKDATSSSPVKESKLLALFPLPFQSPSSSHPVRLSLWVISFLEAWRSELVSLRAICDWISACPWFRANKWFLLCPWPTVASPRGVYFPFNEMRWVIPAFLSSYKPVTGMSQVMAAETFEVLGEIVAI